jgi:tripartite ATP-independent transporter DctM subunit
MITGVMIGLFIVLMALRVPVCFAIGSAALAALLLADIPLDVLPRIMISTVDSFPLLAVPFFILAGNLLNAGGMTERIFDFARALFGWMRGGLAQVNVGASMIFAGMSGAAIADLAGLGNVEMRAMRRDHYPVDFSAAVTLASCVLGPIIPPSIFLVVYGLITNTSIGRLFLGGIIPGLVIGFLLMAHIWITHRIVAPTWGNPEPLRPAELWRTFKRGALALLSPVLVIGAIIGGISTPSEVGAIAAGYALLVGLIYRELTWRRFLNALFVSMQMTAIIVFIVAVASVLGWVITSERVAHRAAELLVAHVQSPLLGLLIINVFLLVVGMFVEALATLLILSPILLPVVAGYGIDPVHFGLIICFNLLLAMITPPMGIGLFVAASVAGTTPERVLVAILPFFIPLLIGLVLICVVPELTLWLPNLVFDR